VYEQLAATKLALVHGPDGMPTGLYAAWRFFFFVSLVWMILFLLY
jgi:hypothetical protein